YRHLIDNINEIIALVDPQGIITYISPALERKTGYLVKDVIGRSFKSLLNSRDIPDGDAKLSQALNGQLEILECNVLDSDGQPRFLHIYLHPIGRNGQQNGLLALVLDFTEKHQIEEALER